MNQSFESSNSDSDSSGSTTSSESTILPATMEDIRGITRNNFEESRDVPADYERQALLLMLLASVCSLHDVTPKTFTVHLLELFERGILDRSSIQFLFDLGLLPSTQLPSLKLLTNGESNDTIGESTDLALQSKPRSLAHQRSLEVSAIRSSLETLEMKPLTKETRHQSSSSSWSAENHPLSLSRYQRDFDQINVLARGGFGIVFHARSKMDQKDYAVKRIVFSASGYSHDAVQRVVREVQCLAACEHPNVVRYYTSWLEPGWMTGNQTHVTTDDQMLNRLLTQGDESAEPSHHSEASSDGFQSLYRQSPFSPPRRSVSSSSTIHVADPYDDSVIEWSLGEDAKDDLHVLGTLNGESTRKTSPTKRKAYSYQVCFYIQMELCQTFTLAEWIRDMNQRPVDADLRLEKALPVFSQICHGLAHIHERGIVHRDLKPANIFASLSDGSDSNFKIGDFGLSKIVDGRLEENEGLTMPSGKGRGSLTAGLGTVSYAAPEQISSNSYNASVDVYSLGLIMLELLCPFSTEHERIELLNSCKEDRVLPTFLDNMPEAKGIILRCTEYDPRRRPSIHEILKDVRGGIDEPTVEEMQKTIEQQAKLIEEYEESLETKDRELLQLKARLEQLEKSDRN